MILLFFLCLEISDYALLSGAQAAGPCGLRPVGCALCDTSMPLTLAAIELINFPEHWCALGLCSLVASAFGPPEGESDFIKAAADAKSVKAESIDAVDVGVGEASSDSDEETVVGLAFCLGLIFDDRKATVFLATAQIAREVVARLEGAVVADGVGDLAAPFKDSLELPPGTEQ